MAPAPNKLRLSCIPHMVSKSHLSRTASATRTLMIILLAVLSVSNQGQTLRRIISWFTPSTVRHDSSKRVK